MKHFIDLNNFKIKELSKIIGFAKKIKKSKNTNQSILKKFQTNDQIMQKAKKTAIFMHFLPANRNQEVADSVIDGKQSVVWERAKNRMYVQQSILYYILKDD